MRKLIENYKKPTPIKWRKIGDMVLLAIPVLELQLESLPVQINPMLKWSITCFLVLFKLYTNTKVEANHYEGKV